MKALPDALGPADPALADYALTVNVGEFIRDVAHLHSFQEVCLAVAETRRLTYDHAVIVVNHRWPRWPLARPPFQIAARVPQTTRP